MIKDLKIKFKDEVYDLEKITFHTLQLFDIK